MVQGDPLADETAPLDVEGRPPQAHRHLWPVAQAASGRNRAVQTRIGAGHPVPLPRQPGPQPLDNAKPRLTAETVESPLPGDRHGGFGERPGETDREQSGTAPQADSTTILACPYRLSVATAARRALRASCGLSSAAPRREPSRMTDYGTAAGASAERGKDSVGGCDHPSTGDSCPARERRFNDLSAKPDICNPMTAGTPTAGSQMGGQRRQAVTDAGRRPAPIGAGRWLIRRRPATVHDGPIAPCRRQVSGSNPLTGSPADISENSLTREDVDL